MQRRDDIAMFWYCSPSRSSGIERTQDEHSDSEQGCHSSAKTSLLRATAKVFVSLLLTTEQEICSVLGYGSSMLRSKGNLSSETFLILAEVRPGKRRDRKVN
ncbi:hypothetical protein L798_03647 [Zootermopsis nevadensis]|uniref:Uncharacterized protein n=1 Tax=Zootermopsis nevadensis TaxID=136037 RepID=A0A067RDH8_ZOONE|nr:hypothetical protein L798_03647 [Zootermopsis nevadensis]